jgi:hypothetical protein
MGYAQEDTVFTTSSGLVRLNVSANRNMKRYFRSPGRIYVKRHSVSAKRIQASQVTQPAASKFRASRGQSISGIRDALALKILLLI